MTNANSKEMFWLEKAILDGINWYTSKNQAFQSMLKNPANRSVVVAVGVAAIAGGFGLSKLFGGKKKSSSKKEKTSSDPIEDEINARPRLDSSFFKRLLHILKIAMPSYKSKEFKYCIILAIAIVTQSFLTNYMNEVAGDLLKHIVEHDKQNFSRKVLWYTGIQGFYSVLSPVIKYYIENLSVDFRKNLTRYIHEKYYSNTMYYKMKNLDKRVQNPDQRITQDVEILGQRVSSLFLDALLPLSDVVINSVRMTQVMGVFAPISIALYVMTAFGVLSLVTPNFTKMSQEIQNREGKFRYIHARTQINGESIAFYQGDKKEKQIVEKYFEDLHSYTSHVINKNFTFGIVNDFFTKYSPHTMTTLIGGAAVFFGQLRYLEKAELLSVMRYVIAIIAFDFLAIGKLIELFKTLLKLSGYTSRVYGLLAIMKDIYKRQMNDKTVKGKFVNSKEIKFQDVSIVTPANVLLAKHLNFAITPGENTAISGPNGCGKSSLFRTLGELWPLKRGIIYKPLGGGLFKDIFYLPQKPYNVIGSLRDQIIYPDQEPKKSDNELQELLELFGIGRLSNGGFDRQQDWDKLSRGEQQRLAMVRLFYHKPRFAILDECTSTINRDAEENLYKQCKNYGITCITISHRPALDAFHTHRMVFDGEGGWKYEQIMHDTYDEELGCKGKVIDSYQLTESESSECEY